MAGHHAKHWPHHRHGPGGHGPEHRRPHHHARPEHLLRHHARRRRRRRWRLWRWALGGRHHGWLGSQSRLCVLQLLLRVGELLGEQPALLLIGLQLLLELRQPRLHRGVHLCALPSLRAHLVEAGLQRLDLILCLGCALLYLPTFHLGELLLLLRRLGQGLCLLKLLLQRSHGSQGLRVRLALCLKHRWKPLDIPQHYGKLLLHQLLEVLTPLLFAPPVVVPPQRLPGDVASDDLYRDANKSLVVMLHDEIHGLGDLHQLPEVYTVLPPLAIVHLPCEGALEVIGLNSRCQVGHAGL
mmetsp:Transcript_85338/g.276332  ORF Transcript_85338/g.276332 Transcript_85338/m.276332 type:complete len:297 (-) Transcript_85338:156-1046(-)